ncbi:ferric iron uptake transcriptional regulator [Paenibacillus eucommiae]|uniref:Fur family ferric uptake transcriptional regulator n=1 Tax=Paenibacillus eucommiae TaxID=1355755 RepID=A0ABS4J6D4_9BACL|nr:Fur family transcriptional regulator [Paenibacillus eucommiae]MBP1994840.1 Fur family ferric uptake transcriptional regulator [Paenibacillus eucommiae]
MAIQVKDERIDKINRQMQSKGYKLTVQREATVVVLLENEEDHLSAEEIFMLVKSKFPDIGLATVYRTLDLLSELHVLEKLNFGDGVTRFDLRNDNNVHLHHHLICVRCGSVDEIMEDWLTELEARVEREFGFQVLDHRLDFQGICHRCRKKTESEEAPQ